MKRRNFLQKLGIGVVTASVLPKVIDAIPENTEPEIVEEPISVENNFVFGQPCPMETITVTKSPVLNKDAYSYKIGFDRKINVGRSFVVPEKYVNAFFSVSAIIVDFDGEYYTIAFYSVEDKITHEIPIGSKFVLTGSSYIEPKVDFK